MGRVGQTPLRALSRSQMRVLPQLGSTVIGVRTKEGVVLCVEKRVTSPLLEPKVGFLLSHDAPLTISSCNKIFHTFVAVMSVRAECQRGHRHGQLIGGGKQQLHPARGRRIFRKASEESRFRMQSIMKIMEVDDHIGAAMSGLTADARTLIEHACTECQNHRFTYNEPLSVESCAQSLCDLALNFGEDGNASGMSRPFGVALLLAGWDDNGPVLYATDPSGTYVRHEAKATGSGSEGAQNALQEQYRPDMTLKEVSKCNAHGGDGGRLSSRGA